MTPEHMPTTVQGEHRFVGLLMADLRGFSVLCERLGTAEVVQVLHVWLGAMDAVVHRYGGQIYDLRGDAILAVFGAPCDSAAPVDRAVAAAIAMQNAILAVNEQNRRYGLPAVEMGVGVHAGEVVLVRIGSGSAARMAVVGQHANLTARVEGFSVGGQVLVSGAVAAILRERLQTRAQFTVTPKGFAEPVTLYDAVRLDGPAAVGLLAPEDLLLPMASPLPAMLQIVEGKLVLGHPLMGEVERVSPRRVAIRLPRLLRPFTDVRVRLTTTTSGETFYAKSLPGLVDGLVVFRFTALPPALAAVLGAQA